MPSATHEVEQVLEIDLSSLSDDDRNSLLLCHKSPDPYVSDDSFPGEMKCRMEECTAVENDGATGFYSLRRTLIFEFTWEDQEAMSEWEEGNTATDDALLPSYVAGDYEGIFVGDDMRDYATDYRGVCT